MLGFFRDRAKVDGQFGVLATPAGVAAARISRRGGAKPRLESCVYERYGNGDTVTRVIGRLSGRCVRAVSVLEPANYRLLLVEAPDVPPDELRAAVRWRVKDLIDFHIDDAVIDVFEMPPYARGGTTRMMYAVTAKAELVRAQIDLIERAGLNLGVVDIAELSLRNVAALLEEGERGAALLHLGERGSTLLLVSRGVLYLARHIETGVASLVEAGELRPDAVAGLALEVRRSLDHYESHYEQGSITQVHTCGLEAADREQIARELGVGVRELDLTQVLEAADSLSPELQRLCLPAVGAALRHDRVVL